MIFDSTFEMVKKTPKNVLLYVFSASFLVNIVMEAKYYCVVLHTVMDLMCRL